MPLFLDANVWLPLVWEGHAASETVHRWAAGRSDDFVLCRVMQMALLRHLTNPVIMGDDVCSNEEAAGILTALRSQNEILFHGDPSGTDTLFPSLGESQAPRRHRWTDAYLAAFAIAGNYDLVSFDRGFARYESQGLRWQLLEVSG